MTRILTLFGLTCLFCLGGGYAVGAMLAKIFEHNDLQAALMWGLAAIPLVATGAWCFQAGRHTCQGEGNGGKA
ncbi:hypothetical protein FF098_009960 [Parvularcula flava]|uniref:Uncharacterized protein n=1 Tax=Aquisalinus luteolus TaxID=1566827 RepID=A0A8J3ER45_9PROT|nr:hypothetical protein [Aquisalinus luteolus]NHK28228.1 hypothetical protein [Aquisalinus luteolus]GGH97849.1 hypothetical protein GCM10011355_20050 [Aquisalinus luteolus]